MSQHFKFFDADLTQAAALVQTIDWNKALKRYDVIESNLSQMLNPHAKAGERRDLAAKLGLLFEQPFFRERRHAELRNETLRQLLEQADGAAPALVLGLAERLLAAGADVNAKEGGRFAQFASTPLELAVENGGSDALIGRLLEAGARVQACGDDLLLKCRRRSSIELLQARGAQWPQQLDGPELSALEMPALEVVCMALREAGRSIAEPDAEGNTALHWAARTGGLAELRFWAEQLPDLNLANAEGQTPLMLACRREGSEALAAVQLLLDKGAALAPADGHGKTALMWAVECTADVALVRTLIQRQADLGARDCNGNTPLHYCAARRAHGHLTHLLVEALLEAGAAADATNRFGHTALMLLAQNAPQACRVLLQRGARTDLRDQRGYGAADYANAEAAELLASVALGGAALDAPKQSPTLSPRSAERVQQVQETQRLQAELLKAVDEFLAHQAPEAAQRKPADRQAAGPGGTTQDEVCEAWRWIRSYVEVACEGFAVETEDCAPEEVDRLSSMLSGPFFVSDEHPQPKGGYPVLQLDLRQASELAGRWLGDGLLQLWELPKSYELRLRVIPRADVQLQQLRPFVLKGLPKWDDALLGTHWDSDPREGPVKVFKQFVSLGVQAESFEFILDERGGALAAASPPGLVDLAQRFLAQRADPGGYRLVQLFGSFSLVQYRHGDVGKPLLFTMRYGSSGSAEVFENRKADGSIAFEVQSAGR